MMDRARLIEILRCPESMQPVREASRPEIDACNRRIAAREIYSKSGVIRSDSIENGLLREDAGLLFPLENGIPVMLIEEALILS